MSESKQHIGDKPCCDDAGDNNGLAMNSGDDSDSSFEVVSKRCPEPRTSHKTVDNSTVGGCSTINVSGDTRYSEDIPFSFTVLKPKASEPMLPTQNTRSCSTSVSSVSDQLFEIANDIDQQMRAEVEKRVGVEREMFARQTAEYEEKILALEAEKHRSHQKNDHVCHRCIQLEQQVAVLEQQRVDSNRKMKEVEDELHALRAERSPVRVPPQQKDRQTFVVVDEYPSELIQQLAPSRRTSSTSSHNKDGQTFIVVDEYPTELIQQLTSSKRTSSTSSHNKWSCPRCTFDNLLSAKECEMCECARPLIL